MGKKVSTKGVQPAPTPVPAAVDMPTPSSMKELQRALGMVNYMGKFIPNLSATAKTSALRSLLNTDANWQWNDEE